MQSEKVQIDLLGHSGIVWGIAFCPGGTRLTTSSMDGTAKLWDAESEEEWLTLTGHSAFLTGIDFSPDGKHMATTSLDGTVRVCALDIEELIELARGRVTRSLTAAECR